MADTGSIRKDSSGEDYLKQTPASNHIHIAYQNFSVSDIDNPYTVMFATEEKHMVSAINLMFRTNYTWTNMVGKKIEFFNPDAVRPFTQLMFEKVGKYYVASVVEGMGEWATEIKEQGEINDALLNPDREEDLVFYGTDDGSAAELIKFTRLNYTTNKVAIDTQVGADFALVLVGANNVDGMKFLVSMTARKYPGKDSKDYTTLQFDREVIPVIELNVANGNRNVLAAAISHEKGYDVKAEHFTSNDTVRVYEPFNGTDVLLKIYTLKRGDRVKYVVAEEPTAGSRAKPEV